MAISEWKEYSEIQALNQVRTDIMHDPTLLADEEMKKWLKLMGSTDPADLVTMKQFRLNVLRKLHGLKVHDHIMPIFSGPQGVGKTEAIRRFVGPLEQIYVEHKDMVELLDDRCALLWKRHPIIFLDEMGRSKQTDIAKLKGRMGDLTIAQRIMRTTEFNYLPNNANLIGATNQEIEELFH